MQAEQKKAYAVGVLVALACSILVSTAVVVLRPLQAASRERDRTLMIVSAAGLDIANAEEEFKKFKPLMVDLRTGSYEIAENTEIWFRDFSLMTRDPERTDLLTRQQDIAHIRRVPHKMLVYTLYDDGRPIIAVFPVYGAGLWSMMNGYLAVNLENLSIRGIRFTEHGETPGLGGEIDNPRWQARWVGKYIFNEYDEPVFGIIRNLTPVSPVYSHSVDALSGATLTTMGVQNMVNFWMDGLGYRNFLDNIRGDRS